MDKSKTNIERFREWRNSRDGRSFIKLLMKECNYTQLFILEEEIRIKSWILSNGQKATKRNWKRFYGNWLRKAGEQQRDMQDPFKNAEGERKYFKNKERKDGHAY